MARSDAAVKGHLQTLLGVATEELMADQELTEREADRLRREAARYASVLSTYIASGLMTSEHASTLMRRLIRTGDAPEVS